MRKGIAVIGLGLLVGGAGVYMMIMQFTTMARAVVWAGVALLGLLIVAGGVGLRLASETSTKVEADGALGKGDSRLRGR